MKAPTLKRLSKLVCVCSKAVFLLWVILIAVLLHTVLIICVPFPFGVWDMTWNSIVSVPDHCLSFILLTLQHL